MTHAHTPGPWIAGNASNGRIFSTWGVFASGKRIATVKGGPDIANARLMAAAPDLLAACELALSEYHPSARDGDPIAERLMSVITRATGRERG